MRNRTFQVGKEIRWPKQSVGRNETTDRFMRQEVVERRRELVRWTACAREGTGMKLDEWVRSRWGSPETLRLGLQNLLTEKSYWIFRCISQMMADPGISPASIFEKYCELKKAQRYPTRKDNWRFSDKTDMNHTIVFENVEAITWNPSSIAKNSEQSMKRSSLPVILEIESPATDASQGNRFGTRDNDQSQVYDDDSTWIRTRTASISVDGTYPATLIESTMGGEAAITDRRRNSV